MGGLGSIKVFVTRLRLAGGSAGCDCGVGDLVLVGGGMNWGFMVGAVSFPDGVGATC